MDSSGNVFVTGSNWGTSPAVALSYCTVKYNSSGTQQWAKTYRYSPMNFHAYQDQSNALALDSSGNPIVTGFTDVSNVSTSNYTTIKYDSTTGSGSSGWLARYVTSDYEARANAIAVDSSDNVYVTGGAMDSSDSEIDMTTIKYNSSGVQQWEARYAAGYGNTGYATALTLDSSGTYLYVAGYSPGTNGQDYVTVKYSTSGGTQQWATTYNGPGNGDDIATGIALYGSYVYVTGYSVGSTTLNDYATIKYDVATGTQQRADRYNGSANGDDRAQGIVATSNGVYVTGYVNNNSQGMDCVTIKYSL